MQSIKDICPRLTEREEQALECVETSQQLLSVLTAYVETHAHTLNNSGSIFTCMSAVPD